MHIVADVLDIDSEGLIGPFGGFAGILHRFGANALLTSVYYDVGVHLAEGFGVAR